MRHLPYETLDFTVVVASASLSESDSDANYPVDGELTALSLTVVHSTEEGMLVARRRAFATKSLTFLGTSLTDVKVSASATATRERTATFVY